MRTENNKAVRAHVQRVHVELELEQLTFQLVRLFCAEVSRLEGNVTAAVHPGRKHKMGFHTYSRTHLLHDCSQCVS